MSADIDLVLDTFLGLRALHTSPVDIIELGVRSYYGQLCL